MADGCRADSQAGIGLQFFYGVQPDLCAREESIVKRAVSGAEPMEFVDVILHAGLAQDGARHNPAADVGDRKTVRARRAKKEIGRLATSAALGAPMMFRRLFEGLFQFRHQ